jgi:hypothetical protein
MTEWKLHIPDDSNRILRYKCGLSAGQHVRLKKELVITDHRGNPIGKVHPKGEQWVVLPGIITDPVLWFREPDGSRSTWSDDADEVAEWFETIEDEETQQEFAP